MILKLVLGAVLFAAATTKPFTTLAGERAFITNQNSSSVSIIDLETETIIRSIDVPGKAAGVTVSNKNFYTISPDDAVLREFDMDGNLCRQLKLAGGPIAVVVNEKANKAFVTDWYEARVFVIDLDNFSKKLELKTGSAPSGIDVSPDGRFLATADRDSNQITIFDVATLEPLGNLTVGERPFGVTFSQTGLVYVTNVGSNSVSVVDPEQLSVVNTIPTGDRPYSVAFAAGKGFVSDQYQDRLTVFDEKSGKPISHIDVGEYPEGIDSNKAGTKIYVANWFSNEVYAINTISEKVESQIEVGDGPRAFGKFVGEYIEGGCENDK